MAFTYRGGEIWGLDPATKTGLAEGMPGADPVLSVENFRAAPHLPPEEIFYLASFWWATKLRRPPEVLVIETPFADPRIDEGGNAFVNRDVIFVLFGLFGIFCGMARCKGVHVRRANIAAWRRFFLGPSPRKGKPWPGEEAKMEARRACALMGWRPPDANAAEAAGVWSYGVGLFAPHKMPPLHKCDPLLARKLFG